MTGTVILRLAGPATLVGDNPSPFAEYGGVGGTFVRSRAGRTGLMTVTAGHAALGQAVTRLTVSRAGGGREFA